MLTPESETPKGLYHSNLVAAFDSSERRAALVSRFTNCVSRAFLAKGSSADAQRVVYWNLLVNTNIRQNEIIDRPGEFIEGLRTIYGDAGTSVFEFMLSREIVREFELVAAVGKEILEDRSISELVRLITHLALG
jgi:hypothetical protein